VRAGDHLFGAHFASLNRSGFFLAFLYVTVAVLNIETPALLCLEYCSSHAPFIVKCAFLRQLSVLLSTSKYRLLGLTKLNLDRTDYLHSMLLIALTSHDIVTPSALVVKRERHCRHPVGAIPSKAATEVCSNGVGLMSASHSVTCTAQQLIWTLDTLSCFSFTKEHQMVRLHR
jgi:hypothetical protein